MLIINMEGLYMLSWGGFRLVFVFVLWEEKYVYVLVVGKCCGVCL